MVTGSETISEVCYVVNIQAIVRGFYSFNPNFTAAGNFIANLMNSYNIYEMN